jgi:hypothetical protein
LGPLDEPPWQHLSSPQRLGVGATSSPVLGAKRDAAASAYRTPTGSTSVRAATTICAGAATAASAGLGRTTSARPVAINAAAACPSPATNGCARLLATTCATLAAQTVGIPTASHAATPYSSPAAGSIAAWPAVVIATGSHRVPAKKNSLNRRLSRARWIASVGGKLTCMCIQMSTVM